MKNRSKLSQDQQQSEQQSAAQENRQQNQEFATSEEMMRFDASGTEVPPQIAERLKRSLSDMAPPARRSWWKNIFGR
jgi:transcription initiation factor TFIID subunit TAF12